MAAMTFDAGLRGAVQVHEAGARLHEAGARLRGAELELRKFERAHGSLSAGLNLQLRAETPAALADLRTQHARLRANCDACGRAFQAALKSWADAKLEAAGGKL